MTRIGLEVIAPCPAEIDGKDCEVGILHGVHQAPYHWCTVWTHPNQHGSFPDYPVTWCSLRAEMT